LVLPVRAKIRRMTLASLAQLEEKTGGPQTATNIRNFLEESVLLTIVMRAIKDLLKLGLIQTAGLTALREWKLYRVTTMGRRVLNQLQK
jgi:DNA-binding PadR family transcriptional regulator